MNKPKRKNGRRLAALVLLFCLAASLFGCAEDGKTAADYADILAATEGLLPYGVWYRQDAAPWEEGYMDEALQRAIFGENVPESEELRLFLCSRSDMICEVCFVSCYTYREAEKVAAVLSARLRMLQKSAKESGDASLDGGFVLLRGRTALYVAAPFSQRIRSSLGL